ncbi:MAG TPA: glycosyltransferase family 2 protein [Alphaproteobacteria bacterium]|nr:glycosyltransferase family 2 protein [Alphaproteobacteria bacterium]
MNETRPAIYIVIPVHNRLDATRDCLQSLKAQTYTPFHVVLVDDGSSDGTSEYVHSSFPEVIVLEGNGNLWWTAATNLGVRYALRYANDTDYILTLNNDTVLPPAYLHTMATLAKQAPNGLIGSIAIDDDRRDMVVDAGIRIHWCLAKFTRLKAPKANGVRSFYQVSTLPGRGTLIPVQVFHTIGLYDASDFPHYAADYDFALRARKAGYILLLHPACYLYSKTKLTGISNLRQKIDFAAWLASFQSIRSPNNLRIRWRFGLRHPPRLCRPSFIVCDFLRVVLGSLRNQISHAVRS